MSGLQAMGRLRELCPGVTVVLVTAYATSRMLEEADDQAVERVLSKPFSLNALMQTLEVAIGGAEPILLVDDDQVFRKTLGDIAIGRGWRTLSAKDADVARRMLDGRSPRLILLDLILRGSDPIEAVRRIKGAAPDTPLVLYSGHDDALERVRGELPAAWFTGVLQRSQVVDYLDRSFP
jgi:CheY-like chemotaxis protein